MVLQTKSAVIILIICSIITISCNQNDNNIPVVSIDLQTTPVIHTEDVSSLISDSGMTRFSMMAKVWQIYSPDADEYWYFPEGIHVEQFDSLFQVTGDIVADTAYYFRNKELWQAIRNVVVKNAEGQIFETSELFWDRKVPPSTMGAFYTDKQVKVTNPDGTFFYGQDGFTSDQSLVNPRFYNITGELNVVESTDTGQQNITAVPDSIQRP